MIYGKRYKCLRFHVINAPKGKWAIATLAAERVGTMLPITNEIASVFENTKLMKRMNEWIIIKKNKPQQQISTINNSALHSTPASRSWLFILTIDWIIRSYAVCHDRVYFHIYPSAHQSQQIILQRATLKWTMHNRHNTKPMIFRFRDEKKEREREREKDRHFTYS